jgi:hypothetical protein
LEFPETLSDLTRKIAKALGEFQTYISNNEEFINELEEVFRHWYPQFRAAAASAPAF